MIAVCQSLTGCVLALATAAALGLDPLTVSVGHDRDWRTGKRNSRIISATWNYENHFWRGILEPLDEAMFYFSLNDEARHALLRNFVPAELTLCGIYGIVPGAQQKYRGPSKPEEKYRSKGYRDGIDGKPPREDPEITGNPTYLEVYLQGMAAGTRRRENGGVPAKSVPSRQRRMNLVG